MAQNDKDDVIAAARAAGRTQQEAATLAGVSRRTVERREFDPAFQARITHYRRLIVSETIGLYMEAGPKTIKALEAVLDNPKAKVSDKIKAAEKIIELMLKMQTQFEVDERLKALEDKFGTGINIKPDRESGSEGQADVGDRDVDDGLDP